MAQANKFKFTKRAIQALPFSDTGRQITYRDTATPNFALMVTKGSKTFYFSGWVPGSAKAERIRIGGFPATTVEQARAEVKKVNGDLARGENPAEAKRAVRQETTFGEHFDDYLERHAKSYKKSWKNDQDNYERYLKHWEKRKLSAIKRADVQRLHSKVGKEHGHYAANRMLATLRIVFRKAVEWGWQGDNPAQSVKQFPEKSRDRFLQGDELPRFFAALAEEPSDTMRDYFTLSLLTGARAANVKAMRWEQINLERGTWFIPETKNNDPQTIPLMPVLVELLANRQARIEGPWVFPADSKTGHLQEPKKAWANLLERAKLENLRMHDLRRSLGSWQAATGANLSVIGKTLNHRNVSTTAIYARLSIDPVRESMEKATAAMLQAGGLLTGGDVVPIKKG